MVGQWWLAGKWSTFGWQVINLWLASGQPGQMVTRSPSHWAPSYFLIRNPIIIIIIWNKTLWVWGLMLFLAFTSELLSSKALVEQQMIAPHDHQSPPPSPLMIPQAKQEIFFELNQMLQESKKAFEWLWGRKISDLLCMSWSKAVRSRWIWWWEQLALIDTKQPNLATEPVN